MKKIFRSIRGMHDFFSEDIYYLNNIEKIIKNILKKNVYSEIRFPILERTDLFYHTIGNYTDVINKEMYSFYDKNNKFLSLRPEGTVSCVRACIQNNIFKNKNIQKFWYLGPMFRYEKPQKGRFRQFFQFGVEVFNQQDIILDCELIFITFLIFKELNLKNYLILEINCIGDFKNREKFSYDLKIFLKKKIKNEEKEFYKLLKKNPIRLLDSKSEKIKKILFNGPILKNYLDKKSIKNFKNLCNFLNFYKIPYIINPNLVRGLDYYNDTVFEWKTNHLGTQNTVCAGGRYDTLIKKLGGKNIPAMGFAIGMERLLMIYKLFNKKKIFVPQIDICIISTENNLNFFSLKISIQLKKKWKKFIIDTNFSSIKLSKKIRFSVIKNTKFIILLDSREILKNKVIIKNVSKNTQKLVNFIRIFQSPCLFK